jgi:bla regulator protein BlaR1
MTQGIEGKVTLEFAIANDGSMQNVRVVQATPVGVFDLDAEQVMQLWRYSPNEEGSLHKIRHLQAFTFSLRTLGLPERAGTVSTSGEVRARLKCQVATGSHICRWPQSNRSKQTEETAAHTIEY